MKFIYPFICCALLLAGCKSNEENTDHAALIVQQQTEQENIALIKTLFQSFNEHDIAVFKELSAPDYQYFSPSVNSPAKSRDEMIKHLDGMFSSSSNMVFEIKDIQAAGNKVFVTYAFNGTDQGNIFGFPSTGNEFEASAIIVYTVQNGQITEVREEGDWIGLMGQLGMQLQPVNQ